MEETLMSAEGTCVPVSGLNPGIRRLVAILNEAGYPTTDSGDGETRDHACDRENAYVVVKLPAHRAANLVAEAEAVAMLLRYHGVSIEPIGVGGEPCIQASYDPGNGTALIDIMGVHDRMLGQTAEACGCGENEACARCPVQS
jgi:hypothetical protein